MRADYKKPVIEFEDFEINEAIASGCTEIISLGPGNDGVHRTCDEYDFGDIGLLSNDLPDNFYEGSCSCYLSAGIGGLMTS